MQHNVELNLLNVWVLIEVSKQLYGFMVDTSHSSRTMPAHRLEIQLICYLERQPTSYRHSLAAQQPCSQTGWLSHLQHTGKVGILHPHSWRRLPQDTSGWRVADVWSEDHRLGHQAVVSMSSGMRSRTRRTFWTSAVAWTCLTDCLSLTTVLCCVVLETVFWAQILDVYNIGNVLNFSIKSIISCWFALLFVCLNFRQIWQVFAAF